MVRQTAGRRPHMNEQSFRKQNSPPVGRDLHGVEMVEQSIALPRKSALDTVSRLVGDLVPQMVHLRRAADARRRRLAGRAADLRALPSSSIRSCAAIWSRPSSPAAMSRRRSGSRSAARSPAPSRTCWSQEGQRVSKGQRSDRDRSQRAEGRGGAGAGRGRPGRGAAAAARELTLPAAREALAQAQATLLNAQQTYDRTAASREERLCDPGGARRRAEEPRRRPHPGAHRRSSRSSPAAPAAATM